MNIYSKILQVLIDCAIEEKTISYKKLAEAINNTRPMQVPETGSQLGKVLGSHLDRVNLFCHNNRLPMLAALVVRSSGSEQGLPGNGFWTWQALHGMCMMDIPRELKTRLHYEMTNRVYRFWKEEHHEGTFGEDYGDETKPVFPNGNKDAKYCITLTPHKGSLMTGRLNSLEAIGEISTKGIISGVAREVETGDIVMYISGNKRWVEGDYE